MFVVKWRHRCNEKGSLGATLKEVRPTFFMGVPRVWEKIQEAITAAGKQNGFVKRWIAYWARSVGLQANLAKMNGYVTQ